MKSWIVFLIAIALFAAILGFGSLIAAAADIAKFIFYLALILIIISAIIVMTRRKMT